MVGQTFKISSLNIISNLKPGTRMTMEENKNDRTIKQENRILGRTQETEEETKVFICVVNMYITYVFLNSN